jgi:plastocyanin
MIESMRTQSVSLSLLIVLSFAVGCGSPGPAPQPAAAGKPVDPATAGSLGGRVTFDGTPPAPQPLKMSADPACAEAAGPNPTDNAVLVSGDGGLQNVFVYVKDGLDPAYSFDVPTSSVELDQHGCQYVPRVLGIRVGQPLEIVNDDDTFHNVHSLPKANQEFNRGMSLKGERHEHTFTTPEVMVRFKCDVHNWMAAWVGVMAHPFFAVTKADGSFEIPGLPPGTYTIEAWHERYGTQTQQVTIGDKQAQTVSFTFTAGN